MDPYLTLKWLHILSSTVLFGTGIGTAFQMVWAMGTRDVQSIHTTARGVVVADWLFTTPAGVAQPATGIALAWVAGFSLTEPWLIATYILYIIAFCAWLPVVWLQMKIRDMAGQARRQNTPLPARAFTYFGIWCALGVPAFLALILVYWLMVAKPLLWG